LKVEVEAVLGEHGALAAALEGFAVRAPQLALAKAVERALAEECHLVAEAGTGTGKTLAYLVPALLSGKTVVVSTATKTLQDQIFQKDLPTLERAGFEVKAALLKGRANYLCGLRFEGFAAQPLFASPDEAAHWADLKAWAVTTTTGDRAETSLPDAWSAWSRLSTTSDSCLGARCPVYEGCFVTRARRKAAESKLVVVNHALFFADLALRARQGEEALAVLPRYDAVVFDEAHALEDAATEHFGVAVSSARVLGLSTDALAIAGVPGLSAHALALKDAGDRFFKDAQEVAALGDGADSRLTEEQLAALRLLAGPLFKALGSLTAWSEEAGPAVTGLARRARDTLEQLGFILEGSEEGHVFHAQRRGRTVWLRGSPISPGKTLAEQLYPHAKTVVMTSATLQVAPKGFDYALQRFGLRKAPHRTLAVGSPFDYRRQVALYLPRHLPEPQAPGLTAALADEVQALVQLFEGRAFVLFTALKQMEAVHALVAPHLTVPVLLQGERPRHALLEAFRERPSVLFASQSFWEGVDVPGDALSLVIIDKLPFQPPNEPLTAARLEVIERAGGRGFDEYQVPRAALALKQGFGRLVRTPTDRGVVAVLDPRLHTKSYGRVFVDSLPPATRLYERAQVEAWWKQASKS